MRAAERRFPVGAEVAPGGGVHFRVWAPAAREVEVVLDGGAATALEPEPRGYFSGLVAEARDGSLYRFRLDGGDSYPDPVSRFQPEGPHGPSQVVDTRRFRWTDKAWRGVPVGRQVIYQLHLGTFTPEGTLAAAMERLPELCELGITTVEFLPLSDFAGTFGWGYDGVNFFAPHRVYGTPDDLHRFVDRAHALGLAVLNDVVYNHFGPDGNYIGKFSPHFVSTRHKTDWGDAVNYDDENAGPVREFVAMNAAYWIAEYHFDGLRLDATQNIYDDSKEHILAVVGRSVREAAPGRTTFVVAENESQDVRLVKPVEEGGYGLDGLWNDDFHHAAIVALTGHSEAYYTDYAGRPQELISALKWGYLYQGQHYAWQRKRRGTSTIGMPAAHFVNYLENHDQVSNVGLAKRLNQLTDVQRLRAATALLLLAPNIPMLFAGQEFASTRPFLFFADHNPDLAPLVQKGRIEFLSQFPRFASGLAGYLPDPADRRTFEMCKLDWSEREKNAALWAMHRDLLRLRREDPAFDPAKRVALDGAVLDDEGFVMRYFMGGEGLDDRLLVFMLGRDLALRPCPEPLLGPPAGHHWAILWSSEDPRYGGGGTPAVDSRSGWNLLGHAAVLLRPEPGDGPPNPRDLIDRGSMEDDAE